MFFQAVTDTSSAAASSAPALTNALSGHITGLIAAVGALGTAAYGLVDTTKSLFGGGVSTRGMAYIESSLTPLLPDTATGSSGSSLSKDEIFKTLKSNWINGVDSDDQQAIAKSLIKLRMDVGSADKFAKVAGVDAGLLGKVIGKMAAGDPLEKTESDTYGRFDLMVSTIVSQAYERADQQYRNTAKLLAIPVSVALSLAAALSMNHWQWRGGHLGVALMLGLVATPLAPIAKDLSSAVQTAAQALQAWKS